MFELRFSTCNAAFHSYEIPEHDQLARSYETSRILHEVMKDLASGKVSGSCIDSNGNKVGSWAFGRLENDKRS